MTNAMRVTQRPAFAKWLGKTNDVTRTFLAAGRIPGLINIAGGLPAPETYPVEEIAEIAERVIRQHPTDTLGYGPIEGLPELRDCLAEALSSPTVRLARENVFITSSGMHGLELLGKVLLDEGKIIAAQFPTYLGALDAWRPRQPVYRSMMIEDAAFDPVAALRGAQFGYAVPNFSNPTGRLIDIDARTRLAQASATTGTWLVEDDPYGGLQYEGPRLPRIIDQLQNQSGTLYDGSVVYMGTVSKQIAPGLRIGWIVAARELIEALTMAKQGSDMCTSGVTQRIALEAIRVGLIDRLQPVVTNLYRERRDALCVALAEHASQYLEWHRPVGGMFVWATLKDASFNTDRLLSACLKAGVCISPSSVFDATGRNRRSLRINFTLNPPEILVEGVRRLVTAIKAVESDRP